MRKQVFMFLSFGRLNGHQENHSLTLPGQMHFVFQSPALSQAQARCNASVRFEQIGRAGQRSSGRKIATQYFAARRDAATKENTKMHASLYPEFRDRLEEKAHELTTALR